MFSFVVWPKGRTSIRCALPTTSSAYEEGCRVNGVILQAIAQYQHFIFRLSPAHKPSIRPGSGALPDCEMFSKSQTLASSPRSPRTPTQRPKLMRAAATAPSLATSVASRKDTIYSTSSGATTLLSRVASISAQQGDLIISPQISPRSTGFSPDSSPSSAGHVKVESCKLTMDLSTRHESDSLSAGAYFSFPSFDGFHDYASQEEQNIKPD